MKKQGFTLAETLAVLGLIGVVIAITIPTLLHNFKDRQRRSAYQAAFEAATQAWTNAMVKRQIVYYPTTLNKTQRAQNFAAFESQFQVMTKCGDPATSTPADISNCWAAGGESWYLGTPVQAEGYAFIDNAGRSWALLNVATDTASNSFIVDTNGLNPPNKLGQDRFPIAVRANDSSMYGVLEKITSVEYDCVGNVPEQCGTVSYTLVCPSVSTHPCYFASWLQ